MLESDPINAAWMARILSDTGDGFCLPEGADQSFVRQVENSDHPYALLVRLLLRLRQGDFTRGEEIARVLDTSNSEGVWISGGHLLAHCIPQRALHKIGQEMLAAEPGRGAGADYTRAFVCRIWARGMMLHAVPEMIEIYQETSDIDARLRILMELADLFESSPGELYDRIDPGTESFDEPAYISELLERHAVASMEAADAGTSLFYRGSPWDFLNWTRSLLERLARGDTREHFGTDRMIFEAHSGWRCSDFFSRPGAALQPLRAAAIVEDFLESAEVGQYVRGVRYFFAHRVPD